ncbi:hypothetical protein B0T11DRAFT_295940 [Plectosphaerella cucumerina]|uniref:Uncharacterized protein n=1 Tax=Plectosphaerella cucumerina TaxID=40658 RepID=A0A8K0TPC8_9PEZI|nr:hypothetical protein B0T11DRAFT_295940 [Plectosphaerella cucumerina]
MNGLACASKALLVSGFDCLESLWRCHRCHRGRQTPETYRNLCMLSTLMVTAWGSWAMLVPPSGEAAMGQSRPLVLEQLSEQPGPHRASESTSGRDTTGSGSRLGAA